MQLYKGFAGELMPYLEPTSSEFLCNIAREGQWGHSYTLDKSVF